MCIAVGRLDHCSCNFKWSGNISRISAKACVLLVSMWLIYFSENRKNFFFFFLTNQIFTTVDQRRNLQNAKNIAKQKGAHGLAHLENILKINEDE